MARPFSVTVQLVAKENSWPGANVPSAVFPALRSPTWKSLVIVSWCSSPSRICNRRRHGLQGGQLKRLEHSAGRADRHLDGRGERVEFVEEQVAGVWQVGGRAVVEHALDVGPEALPFPVRRGTWSGQDLAHREVCNVEGVRERERSVRRHDGRRLLQGGCHRCRLAGVDLPDSALRTDRVARECRRALVDQLERAGPVGVVGRVAQRQPVELAGEGECEGLHRVGCGVIARDGLRDAER